MLLKFSENIYFICSIIVFVLFCAFLLYQVKKMSKLLKEEYEEFYNPNKKTNSNTDKRSKSQD